jgi:hypothetical protein
VFLFSLLWPLKMTPSQNKKFLFGSILVQTKLIDCTNVILVIMVRLVWFSGKGPNGLLKKNYLIILAQP